MNIKSELKNDDFEALAAAKLTSAFTLLAMVAYDSWGHEGTPAEMAALVIRQSKDRGNLGFIYDILGLYADRYGRSN